MNKTNPSMKPSLKPSFIAGLIGTLEGYPISVPGYLLAFLSISFVRNFLEGAMESSRTIGTGASQDTTILQMAVLFNLEWLALFAALALAIYAFTRTPLLQLLKLMLFFFAWIIIVPLIDLALYYPSGCRIDYLFTLPDYIRALKFFFIPTVEIKICYGIRFEVFAAFAMCWAYVFIKTKNLLKASLCAISLYLLAVSSMAYPVFILLPASPLTPGFDALVNKFFFWDSYGGEFIRRNSTMIFMLLVPLLAIFYRIHYGHKKFMEFLGGLFGPVPLMLTASFLCGFLLAPGRPGLVLFSNPFDIFLLFSGCLTCLIFGLYLKVSARGGDKLVPLYITLILISSLAVSFNFFLFFVFLSAVGVFFNRAPFNLSSYPKTAALLAPVCASALFLAGFSIITGSWLYSKVNFAMPLLVFACVFLISLAAQHGRNGAILSLLTLSIVLTAPAISSPLFFIISAAAAAACVYIARFSGSKEENYKRLGMILALLLALAGFFGRM